MAWNESFARLSWCWRWWFSLRHSLLGGVVVKHQHHPIHQGTLLRVKILPRLTGSDIGGGVDVIPSLKAWFLESCVPVVGTRSNFGVTSTARQLRVQSMFERCYRGVWCLVVF